MGEEELFEKAVSYVNGTMKESGIKLSTEQKLQLESWKQLGSMQKEDAMKGYTEVLCKLVPKWNADTTKENTQQEEEEGEKKATQQQQPQQRSRPKSGGLGPVFSTLVYSGEEVPEEQRDICYWASDGDLDKVKEKLNEGAKIDTRDGDYRTPLMWASDRGHLDVVEFLLSSGADVNLQDSEGMTPLHYAAMCEYEDIVRILLKHNADPSIKDSDGKTPKDVADENLDISVFDVK